jgi:hypothetical protein
MVCNLQGQFKGFFFVAVDSVSKCNITVFFILLNLVMQIVFLFSIILHFLPIYILVLFACFF